MLRRSQWRNLLTHVSQTSCALWYLWGHLARKHNPCLLRHRFLVQCCHQGWIPQQGQEPPDYFPSPLSFNFAKCPTGDAAGSLLGFLRAKKLLQDTLWARQGGTHALDEMLRLLCFFNTRPKQAQLKVNWSKWEQGNENQGEYGTNMKLSDTLRR